MGGAMGRKAAYVPRSPRSANTLSDSYLQKKRPSSGKGQRRGMTRHWIGLCVETLRDFLPREECLAAVSHSQIAALHGDVPSAIAIAQLFQSVTTHGSLHYVHTARGGRLLEELDRARPIDRRQATQRRRRNDHCVEWAVRRPVGQVLTHAANSAREADFGGRVQDALEHILCGIHGSDRASVGSQIDGGTFDAHAGDEHVALGHRQRGGGQRRVGAKPPTLGPTELLERLESTLTPRRE